MIKGFATVSALAATVALAACTVHQSDTAPSLKGPSDFAQSFSITATPDTIIQELGSSSGIVVTVHDSAGRPAPDVLVRLDMFVGGTLVDFGTLSPRAPTTGSDGKASARYSSPAAPPPASGGTGTSIDILATPIGSDALASFQNGARVSIRLVPRGVILPPAGTPTADFIFSPVPAVANVPVNFDASASLPGTNATSLGYDWTFGDGSSASGRTVTKTFTAPGTFNVTLTVTNDRGLASSKTQVVSVGTSAAPTADFNFSPASPVVFETVNFTAVASRAASGRSIVSYSWDFLDGTRKTVSVPETTHDFGTVGQYDVTLTVTDDVGQRTTVKKTVTVATANPIARLTLTKGGALNINADGSASSATGSSTIANYSFNWGDGTGNTSGPSPQASHSYGAPGTYTVILTVTDNFGPPGRSATTSQTITVP